jgi:hypothetical protein
MAQDTSNVLRNEFILPDILVSHLRWMIVLAKLKELDLSDAITSVKAHSGGRGRLKGKKSLETLVRKGLAVRKVAELVCELKLESLFTDITPIVLEASSEGFGKWFGIKEEKQIGRKSEGDLRDTDKSSPFNTIYQCRNFYALDAPNNLVQRLSKMLEAALSKSGFETNSDKGSRYDKHIRSWGKYAFELVQANGGWKSFSEALSLTEVQDIWIESHTPVGPELADMADHYNSFVQRVLHLERDRYIQILNSTVAMHWPLWFLKSHERSKSLKEIVSFLENDKKVFIGRPLPNENLFIDINLYIGQMAGLPYPFGVADDLLSMGDEFPGMKYREFGNPWPSSAQEHIGAQLRYVSWNPPLLFGVRADTFPPLVMANENHAAPLIQLSSQAGSFFNFYVRNDVYLAKNKVKDRGAFFKKLRFAVEPGTYGDKVIQRLLKAGKLLNEAKTFSRRSLAKSFSDVNDVDIVASYPPVDTLIQASEQFKKLTGVKFYDFFVEDSFYFPQHFSNTFLCCGISFMSQPRAAELVLDLCSYLGKVDFLFRYLLPDQSSLEAEFSNLHMDGIRHKIEAANKISEYCRVVGQTKSVVAAGIVEADIIETWLKQLGVEISSVLYRVEDEACEKEFTKAWNDWAWALQLEFQKYTLINVSHNLL